VNVQASIFIARLLGPILLAVGAGILINPSLFRTMGTELVRSVTLVYLFGIMDFAAGLAIVLTHNVWLLSWRVLITLIGWLLLIRGAVRILLTEKVMSLAANAFRNKLTVPVAGAVVGVLGLVLCYFGYVA
jgi:membrane protein CcdC involved in cytochrome C biogenesis